jgi:predicted DNA-binding transcriptional regulator AlpA
MTKPKTYSFILYLSGPDVLTDENMDALHESGCDDALFGERDGAQYAAFDRETTSFRAALKSALSDLTSAVSGLRIVRIAPEEFVTLSTIAERAGLSREYVRLLANQQRGPGGFPSPVAYADHKTRLWHWADVAEWLQEHKKSKTRIDTEGADLVLAMNAALSYQRHARHLHKADLALVAEAVGGNPFIRD